MDTREPNYRAGLDPRVSNLGGYRSEAEKAKGHLIEVALRL
jgi:hypothetical protein